MTWPTLIPHGWAATPWAASVVSLLLLIAFGLDLAFARRYAGGHGQHDRGTNQLLILSLNANLCLGLLLAALGVGRLTWRPDLLAAVGSLLGTFGIVLRYGAIMTLGRYFTWRVNILEDHRLVEHGLFRWIRHPSYTGGILAVAGCFLALGNAYSLAIFSLTHVPLLLYRVRIEEQVLVGHFGEAYRAYMKRSWRLLPGIW